MAKPKIPNQKNKYGELNKRLAKYVALVQSIYDTLNLEAAKLVEGLGVSEDDLKERPFSFSEYPETRNRINDIQKRFVSEINAIIYRGTSEEWKISNEVQDLLANAVLKTYDAVIDKEKYKVLYQTNSDALKAFHNRKDKGLNVSDKLWNQSVVYKNELEDAISCAIEKGYSAVTLSKRISKYLLDFPSLQKDYKEKFGTASKAADCEYRSLRLAASEINMAYRTAENKRWEQMDFVVGYEIKLSGNHNCKGVPKGQYYDICDMLAGKYPKDFVWTGWHPLCRCYKIPILKTEEEFWNFDGRNTPSSDSVNCVKNVPDNFNEWLDKNVERIQAAKNRGTLPYFLRDNKDIIEDDDLRIIVKKKTVAEIAKKRHANRDDEAIKRAWKNRDLIMNNHRVDSDKVAELRKYAKVYGIDISEFENYIQTHEFEDGGIGVLTDNESLELKKRYDKQMLMVAKESMKINNEKSKLKDYINSIPYNFDRKEVILNELSNLTPVKSGSVSAFKDKLNELRKAADSSLNVHLSTPLKFKESIKHLDDFDTFDLDCAITPVDKYQEACSLLSRLYGGKMYSNTSLSRRMQDKLNNGGDFLEAFYDFKDELENKGLMEVMESINHLKAIYSFDTSKLPREWIGRFNDCVVAINNADIGNEGYFRVYRHIEGAYNMMKLSTDPRCIAYGLDRMSCFTPHNLIDGFESIGINPFDHLAKKEFYDQFDIFVPLISKNADEAYYSPKYNHVRIDFIGDKDRFMYSESYRENLQYHEFGHAADNLLGGWRRERKWESLFDKYASDINDDWQEIEFYDGSKKLIYGCKIKDKYDALGFKSESDAEELMGVLSDVIISMDKTHEWFGSRGHSSQYFSSKSLCLAEFIAHASECYWHGNKYFKQIWPELYDDMVKLYEEFYKKSRFIK